MAEPQTYEQLEKREVLIYRMRFLGLLATGVVIGYLIARLIHN